MTIVSDEKEKTKNIRYYLKNSYILLEILLIASSFSILNGYYDPTTGNIDQVLYAVVGFIMALGVVLFHLLEGIINSLYTLNESINVLSVHLLSTSIFFFSLIQSPMLFATVSFWWGVFSPFSLILRPAIERIPFFHNKKLFTATGLISALIGFSASFLRIEVLRMFDVFLTIFGALLTTVSIGYPETLFKSKNSDKEHPLET